MSDREKSGVSGPIQFIKMQSCVQCAMQEKSVCCRDVPCLAHMEQGPDPSTQGICPPPLSAWPLWKISLLATLNKDCSEQWSGHLQTAQPRTCGPWRVNINIILYFSSSNTVFWNVPPNGYLCSTDCCYIFFVLINHIME